MIKIVPVDQVVFYDDFPYDWEGWDYAPDLLRSTLYSPDDPTLCPDGYMMVMTYDDFIEWFPKWIATDPDPIYKPDEAEEYLPYHIGRTVEPIKGVRE